MGQQITVGGDRLGAGKKIKQELRNYDRSTFDLSESFVSSMSCGTLVPMCIKPMMRGDVFEIEADTAARTIPTEGPLFGSFKLQGDFFFVPVRLYQALLHNNPTSIGLKMNQVKLPKLIVDTIVGNDTFTAGKNNLSSLLKYLGMSGLGRCAQSQEANVKFGREIMAVPMLGYYDIYKEYYANKQEESGRVIGINNQDAEIITTEYVSSTDNAWVNYEDAIIYDTNGFKGNPTRLIFKIDASDSVTQNLPSLVKANINESLNGNSFPDTSLINIINNITPRGAVVLSQINANTWSLEITQDTFYYNGIHAGQIIIYKQTEIPAKSNSLVIKEFPLANIDDMRMSLLSKHTFGVPFKIADSEFVADADWNETSGTSGDGLPYSTLIAKDFEGKMANKYAMNGLCIKTYQNDIFNTWMNTEWIDGENGINELTKVAVTDGAFKINSLIFAEKLYNMYNRIAISGATYDEWLDVVYQEERELRSIEKPIYVGGLYNEIVFEEIVQTTPAEGSPLGELGGRGKLVQETQGGKITVKATEPGFLIGIASITPRTYYTQGNEFYLTELESVDDFHKPELDGIGFQDLIGERMAYFDTVITPASTNVIHRSVIGKLPAWMEYMTSTDKAFGDLAEPDGNGYMILNRNYEQDEQGIVDASTYIDPEKYNYAFAYTALDAQNFWVQFKLDIKARRLMSAKQIPNL